MNVRRALAALLAVALLGGSGALLLDRVVGQDDTTVGTDDGTTVVAPGSTEPRPSTTTTAAPSPADDSGFPTDIPRDGDAECSVPRTDPDHPAIAPAGEATDGVEVSQVTVTDRAEGEVVVTASVSHRPVVQASSGTSWVVIGLSGVRRVATENVTVETAHARAEPATVCDDSASALAYSFDGRVTGLELLIHSDTTVEILIRLG